MAVDANETKRQRVFEALADSASRTWARDSGQNRLAFTIANPVVRVLNGTPVVSVDLLVTRNGRIVYDDRLNFPNPPLLVRNADGTNTFAPLRAMRIILEQEVERATRNFTGTRLERNADGTFRGDTLVVFATEDGYVSSNNASITSARSGSNLTVTTTSPNRVQAALAASVYYFRITYMAFDTSALGAGATITANVLSLAGNGTAETNADSISMLAQYYDYGAGDPATADWINLTTSWSGLVDVGSFTVSGWDQTSNAYNAFSDSGNYSSIAKAGVTRIVVGTSLHPSGTPTGANQVEFHASEAAGTTGDPKLTITYTPAVSVSVTGVTATAPAAGIAGVVTAVQIASITGVTGAAPAAGIAGVVTAQAGVSIAVTGVTATAPASGEAGAVAAVRTVTIAGVTGEAPTAGIAGAVQIQATITGVAATATATGVAGVVTAARTVSITGVTGAAPAAGIAGVVAAQNQVTIVGVTATADAAGIAGSVAAQVQIAVTGVTGAASADGIAGTVATVRIVTITGVTGQAPAAGVAGVVAAVQIVVVTGVTGTATAEGFAGTATGVRLSVILIARYAPLSEFTARYAPQTEVSARYAPQSEFSGRYAPQTETEARYG